MLKSLLTLENLWKGLGHMTRWVLVPLIMLAVTMAGLVLVSTDLLSPRMQSEIASLWYVFIAVTAWWLMRRWLNWLNGVRFKKDVAPLIYQNALSAAIHSVGQSLALAILISSVLATVRF
ncbi:MAG TPA: hypothetical protein VM659_28900 [Dongiaceae bacterium]|nr:hypothetical protein [Dongiaceae bacterium]